MKHTSSTTARTKNLVAVAMLCAFAYIVSFCIPIKVSFLTFDAKDSIIAIGGMFFGPLAAIVMSIIVPFMEFLTLSDTGIYGLIMNFLSSAAFSVTASLVYKYRRKMSGAVMGLASAVAAVVIVMMAANIFITPYYMGVSREMVIGLIPTLLLPFNAAKAVLNAALVLYLYKPFTSALRAAKLITAKKTTYRSSIKITVIAYISAFILLAAAAIVLMVVLKGDINLIK